MPAYRFSWEAFDDSTVTALAAAIGHPGGTGARDWLATRVRRPTEEFVRETKEVLERHWLPSYPAATIVERLLESGIGPMGTPKTQAQHVAYIRKCRNASTIRRLLVEALLRHGDMDRATLDDDEGLPADPVRRFGLVRPSEQPVDARRPHPYQVEAWDRLSKHFAEAESTGRFRGLLVMPTGSGKTYTATHWLLRKVVERGQKVLWLAHRQELLTQAAASFYALARIVTTRERLRIRIISREHCGTTRIDPADDILICSIGSLARRPDIAEMLLADGRFIVVDEAHHAPMKSYRDIIESLAQQRRGWLLGLTATPTRTIECERPILSKLFDGRVLMDVPIKDLIERKVLARPIPVRVETGAEVERGVTDADLEHITRFNELSEEWLDRIAHLSARNQIIVKHYLDNRAKYRKTLVFAINVHHAALLADDLRRRGVSADYVASYRPDGSDRDANEIIASFRKDSREGGLDVLVNVQILTEGVDVPAVQTVFLTRPTSSEILLRQMIGRGLRGRAAGGTDEAYLVSFEDHWEQFREWQGQLSLVPDILAAAGTDSKDPSPSTASPGVVDVLPWELIRAYAARIAASGRGYEANVFEAVPHGWIVLERTVDGQDVCQYVAVYEHQHPSWHALIERLVTMTPAELSVATDTANFDEFFYDCDVPKPALHEVRQMLEHFRAGGGRPMYQGYEARSQCDPYVLAHEIWTADLGERKKRELLEQRYTQLARAIYPTIREFHNAIEDALYELAHPEEANRNVPGIPVFEPRPEQQLAPGPCHDLNALMPQVLAYGASLLGVNELPFSGRVEWSKRLIKGWYGKAYWDPGDRPGHGLIRINRLLDSPDIHPSVIWYLLWHEYLHLYLQGGHTPQFRALEWKWPQAADGDRVLDNLNERFGVQYW